MTANSQDSRSIKRYSIQIPSSVVILVGLLIGVAAGRGILLGVGLYVNGLEQEQRQTELLQQILEETRAQ